MQERCSGNAISSTAFKPCGIHRPAITTDDVVSRAAGIIGIVDPELGVIKDVECLGTELKLASFSNLEIFQQRQVEVHAAGIIQEVSTSISEGEAARRHEL